MLKKKVSTVIAAAMALALFLVPNSSSAASNSQLTVDLSTDTGSLLYGATGFLYGLGNEGIPTDNMLAPLKTQYASQKPPGGLQHPNGDVLDVENEFFRTGGKQIQIIMQDIYKNWPYDNLGIDDYLAKVDTMLRTLTTDPNHANYVYVPFNEPDLQWYNKTDKLQNLFNDWKTVYDKIRSIDPSAKIAGLNFSSYDSSSYNQFMTFAKNNNCLPDVTTWHELQNSFFTGWYTHYNDYRSIETNLGISPRPISINEYGRAGGVDIPVPGNLVQYIARFENSKVYGSLAYWTTAGGLNDLVTQNNQATGGWWLYKWYGDLTGHTVTVTPPSVNGSLQGLAALDSDKKQARIIFGGSAGSTDVFNTDIVVKGFGSASYFGGTVHATVWGVDNTGLNPSSGPYIVQEGDYPVSNGQITVTVPNMKALSAYHMIVTPATSLSTTNTTNRYEAEYAALSGTAKITYGTNTGYSGTYFVEGYGGSSNASTNFVVTAPSDGYYNVMLRYSAGPLGNAPANRSIRVMLNGSKLVDAALAGTADWNTWNNKPIPMFLNAGINRIGFNAYTSDDSDAINIDYIDVTASNAGQVTSYEAEASGNTLGGKAVVAGDTAASGGQYVGWIGGGASNTLQFNNVTVPTAGLYRMVVTYANGELGSGASNYNSNIVDRYADISVNGGSPSRSYFRNTLGWSNYRTTEIDVNMNAGSNTIKFSNSSSGYAPNIDKIQIAALIVTDPLEFISAPDSVKVNTTFDQMYGVYNVPSGAQSISATFMYDTKALQFVSAEPVDQGSGLQVAVDSSSTPGQVTIHISGGSGDAISSSNALKLHWQAVQTEQTSTQIALSGTIATNDGMVSLNNTVNSIGLYADATSISVNGTNGATAITDNKGTLQMKVNVLPANASSSVTWNVTDLQGAPTDIAAITVDGMLTASGNGKNGTVKVTAAAKDGSGVKGEALISISGQLPKITGTLYGLGPAWSAGGEYDKAFDGNVNTYYDYANANGGYTGIDLGAGNAKQVKQIRFFPRSGFTNRMVGGQFQGSNTSPTSGFVTLYTITATPPLQWNVVPITNTTAYRYLRYLSPNGGYGNVAEIEFYGPMQPVSSIAVQSNSGSQVITEKGGTLQMTATIEPEDASDKSVVWSVTNPDGTPTNAAVIDMNGNLTATGEGKAIVVATAKDGSGVYGASSVTIDTEPPVTSALMSPLQPNGLQGWYKGPVTVTLSAYDAVSGVAASVYSMDVGMSWMNYTAPLIFNQDGLYSISYRSTDNVGHIEATKTESLKIDGTAPTITLSVQESYMDSESFTPVFTTIDNGSGIDASKTNVTLDGAPLKQGETVALYTLTLGAHTLVVSAADQAGNVSTVQKVFQLNTSLASLHDLVGQFASRGWIDNSGIVNSLQAKLKEGDVNSFINEVNAQSGKHLTKDAATILLRDANVLKNAP